MSEPQARALREPVRALRAALDGGRYGAAIGAAKDLAEAACKLAIERTGSEAPANASLPVLFREASRAVSGEAPERDAIGRSLAATVQRLAELRNAVGAGHGHASIPDLSAGEARLAASAASGVAAFLLANRP